MADPITGRCLCGKVRFEAPSKPLWTALCHCESCRRATSAPIAAWMGFPEDAVRWQGERSFYQSSEASTRSFCPRCGTPMSFESTRWPGETHLYAVSADAPEDYVPVLHCYYTERLPWLAVEDDLPKHAGAADAHGSEGTL